MKKKIFIYGAGGLGREVAALLGALPAWELTGFIDDHVKAGTLLAGIPVCGDLQYINNVSFDTDILVAIGSPHLKRDIIGKLQNPHLNFPVIIHPHTSCLNASCVDLGKGTIVSAGVRLTTDISIGDHVLLNLNDSIGHDCRIGNFCSIMPGVNISGEVELKESVFIGSGSNIKNRIIIGEGSIVGMGSVVIRDVDPRTTVAGVPAKIING